MVLAAEETPEQGASGSQHEVGSFAPTLPHQAFREATVSFAVDISGSTFGQTLLAEKAFIKTISNLLQPRARFESKVLPWDDRAHPIISVGQVHRLEDQGGTDPGAILTSDEHKKAILESSLWFLMTDGLIQKEARAEFASNVAKHGIHGINCVVVVFGNPSTGPASCDISVGIGVFAAVPNCAFLFCNETNGDLRVLQTKGTFNVLLKGQRHPSFDSSSRWDSLPQVSAADFSDVTIPQVQRLRPDEVALQDSLVIRMEDLFANKLPPEHISRIFGNQDNLATVIKTSQARNQQDRFQTWVQQQTIRPDDPLHKPRADHDSQAEKLFTELSDILRRDKSPPPTLQARLRAAYCNNMKRFMANAQRQIVRAEKRKRLVISASASSSVDIDNSTSLSHSVDDDEWCSEGISEITYLPLVTESPSAHVTTNTTREERGQRSHEAAFHRKETVNEEVWGSWEDKDTDSTLRGLLYTPGVTSFTGSFKGSCPLCGASDITMAWLFRAAAVMPFSPSSFGSTAGFPQPHSHTHLAFPLAMGHFSETSRVLATAMPRAAPVLVCEPCSTFYTQDGALSFGTTAALPLVCFAQNREFVCRALAQAFEGRFLDADLPQVFLSVLLLAADRTGSASSVASSVLLTPASALQGRDIEAAFASAAAAKTFRSAVEWAAKDLLQSVPVLRELSGSFSLPGALPSMWPLGTVLSGLFDELQPNEHGRNGLSILKYPLEGFIVMLRAAALLKVGIEARNRAVFWRLLYRLCEDLSSAAQQLPPSQSMTRLFGGLLGEPALSDITCRAQQEETWARATSVNISSLRLSPLLSETSYSVMQQAEEFRDLEAPSLTWVGSAIATFLYALFLKIQDHSRMGAWEMFEAVCNDTDIWGIVKEQKEMNESFVNAA